MTPALTVERSSARPHPQERQQQLIEVVRRRDQPQTLRLVEAWVHRQGLGSLDTFRRDTLPGLLGEADALWLEACIQEPLQRQPTTPATPSPSGAIPLSLESGDSLLDGDASLLPTPAEAPRSDHGDPWAAPELSEQQPAWAPALSAVDPASPVSDALLDAPEPAAGVGLTVSVQELASLPLGQAGATGRAEGDETLHGAEFESGAECQASPVAAAVGEHTAPTALGWDPIGPDGSGEAVASMQAWVNPAPPSSGLEVLQPAASEAGAWESPLLDGASGATDPLPTEAAVGTGDRLQVDWPQPEGLAEAPSVEGDPSLEAVPADAMAIAEGLVAVVPSASPEAERQGDAEVAGDAEGPSGPRRRLFGFGGFGRVRALMRECLDEVVSTLQARGEAEPEDDPDAEFAPLVSDQPAATASAIPSADTGTPQRARELSLPPSGTGLPEPAAVESGPGSGGAPAAAWNRPLGQVLPPSSLDIPLQGPPAPAPAALADLRAWLPGRTGQDRRAG